MSGKVALVTGSSGGIGLATARLFAELGASVVLSARHKDVLDKEVAKLTAIGQKAVAIPADVTDPAQVESLIKQTVEHFGRLDYAVNNAGIITDRIATHELAQKDWDNTISVNLTSVWLCMKHELAQMVKQGSGSIVNLSSVAGIMASPQLAAYTASKHGVVGLSKGAGAEYAAQGIRVNAVCPGWVDTPMTAEFGSDPERRKLMNESAPIHRTAQPEEIAAAIVWLCSDSASFITAAVLPVDGGLAA